MNNNHPRFLILSGDGINCERETSKAFELAGASPEIVHINDLLAQPSVLKQFQGMALPGGFSFGDELGSGQVLALKIRYGLSEEFQSFIAEKKPMIGICNGFQVLVKLGLLPDPNHMRTASLMQNKEGSFINCWVPLRKITNTVCKWTQKISDSPFELPIRHGEGRIVFLASQENVIYERLQKQGQIPLIYEKNVNGSFQSIAALCDPTGLIFGLMPHPEAYVFEATSRHFRTDVFQKGPGQLIFESIVSYLHE
ncbi:MAG: phosphoribosylformylglycinamidine synthase subunit PurQ [Planctomycetota bacterium]